MELDEAVTLKDSKLSKMLDLTLKKINLMLYLAFGLDAFTWGSGNLTDAGEMRKQYIASFKSSR